MRKLTVIRRKAFLAYAGVARIYVEDHNCPELTIGSELVPCRKLGDLKNGQTGTYDIPETGVKIFVIADIMTRDAFNECYQLNSGSEDLTLTGGYSYGPGGENVFRFDNNQNGGAFVDKRLKKEVNKRIIVSAIVGTTVIAVIGAILAFLT